MTDNPMFSFRDPRPAEQVPHIVARDIHGKEQEVPSSFIDWNQKVIPVYNEHVPREGEPARWKCPRDGSNTIQVSTELGIMLYCFDCKIFYNELGHWGYKT